MTRHPWWMSLGECEESPTSLGPFRVAVVSLHSLHACEQVNPGHGDFGEHVGLHPGREDQAVRPSQQSDLQTIQTGQTITETSVPRNVTPLGYFPI